MRAQFYALIIFGVVMWCLIFMRLYVDEYVKKTMSAKLRKESKEDGCELNWLFQISTGRSGSTSLMNMLNQLPNVYIAGENGGIMNKLYDLHTLSIRTGYSESKTKGAWWHHRINRFTLQRNMRTYVESAIGIDSYNYSWVGFKEIRHKDTDVLDFMMTLFPCSKFIVNIRQDVASQSKSAWYGSNKNNISEKLLHTNEKLIKWCKMNPERVFTISLEEFTLENLNRLASWLGFPNCKYFRISHSNKHSGYNIDNHNVVTC